jgi:hypothetical protein
MFKIGPEVKEFHVALIFQSFSKLKDIAEQRMAVCKNFI